MSQPAMVTQVPEGPAGVRETLKVMRRLVRHFKHNLTIHSLASEIISEITGKDFPGEVDCLFHWVRENIRYQKDINETETISTPLETLASGFGDCDDSATLLATMLETTGHKTRFKAVGFSWGVLSHVYTQTQIGDHWFALDTTEPNRMGWEPPGIVTAMLIYNGKPHRTHARLRSSNYGAVSEE